MSILQLQRPLVVFDLETTGTVIGRDRIVEIGAIRLEPDGRRREWTQRIDPGQPIPAEATRVHGITDADVRGMPTLEEAADRIHELLAGADVAGFNSSGFDLPFLAADLKRVGRPLDETGLRQIDAMRIFHLKEPRDLSAALRFYCGREHAGAHSALADAAATLDILEAQLERYADLPRDPDGLHDFCRARSENWIDDEGKFVWNEAGEAVFTFGKHKGRTLREVAALHDGYLEFLQRSDIDKPFSPEVRKLAKDALAGIFRKREQPASQPPQAAPQAPPARPARPAAAASPPPPPPAPAPAPPPAPAPGKKQGELFS